MNNLDREIDQLERRLNHLRDLRDRRDERIYRSDRPRDGYYSYDSQEVSYFPLILIGLVFALLLI